MCRRCWRSGWRRRASLLGMTTRGDQIVDRTLSKVGGKGLFVKELETALRVRRARTWPCIRSRTCRWSCRPASSWWRCWIARIRATRSCRTVRVARRPAAGRAGRHVQPAPRGAAAGAAARPARRAAARQPRHPPAQARRGRLRRHRAGRRRPDAPGPGRPHPRALRGRRDDAGAGQGALAWRSAPATPRCTTAWRLADRRRRLARRARGTRGRARAGRQLQHAAGGLRHARRRRPLHAARRAGRRGGGRGAGGRRSATRARACRRARC